MPGVSLLREELGVVLGPGADPVEVVGVEAVGELLAHDGALHEGEVRHVARQPDQDGTSGLLVDAGDRHRVGPQAPAPGAGVAAEQEHVVAAVVGAGGRAAAEHREHEVALHADEVGAEEQRAGDREAEDAVDADRGAAVAHRERQRLTDPPGVDEQGGPADRGEHQGEAEQPQHQCVGGQPEDQLVPGETDDEGRHDPDDQREPEAQGDQADPAVAGDELGRTGQDQGHRHQGHGTAEAHAGRPVTGGEARDLTVAVVQPGGRDGWHRDASLLRWGGGEGWCG